MFNTPLKSIHLFAVLCVFNYMDGYAQHSFGIRFKAGALSSLNKSLDHHLIGFEKALGIYYRFEPKKAFFGLQSAINYGPKKYAFRFESNQAFLKQTMFNLSLMALVKLKHNGARFLFGFNTGFLVHAQTELASTIGNTTHFYSDDALNSLQHTNNLQIDLSVELDQPIGLKQKFVVGLEVNQNVNNILTADFVYPYYDAKNKLSHLTISKNLFPLTAAIVLKYKIK